MSHHTVPSAALSPNTQEPPARISTPADKLIFALGDTKSPHRAKQFTSGALDKDNLNASPLLQFHAWFGAAQAAGIPQAEACTLATASLPSGRVSARIVYLKELDGAGFVVFSNWGSSRKAADVGSNAQAALTFWWREMERQVRVEGAIERITSEESQRYFDTRIRGSRIGAWASRQSSVLSGREELDGQVADVEKRFEGEEQIPVPEFWGGARITPDVVEFWQGRESRLHDRFQYVKEGDGWEIRRLSP